MNHDGLTSHYGFLNEAAADPSPLVVGTDWDCPEDPLVGGIGGQNADAPNDLVLIRCQ